MNLLLLASEFWIFKYLTMYNCTYSHIQLYKCLYIPLGLKLYGAAPPLRAILSLPVLCFPLTVCKVVFHLQSHWSIFHTMQDVRSFVFSSPLCWFCPYVQVLRMVNASLAYSNLLIVEFDAATAANCSTYESQIGGSVHAMRICILLAKVKKPRPPHSRTIGKG